MFFGGFYSVKVPLQGMVVVLEFGAEFTKAGGSKKKTQRVREAALKLIQQKRILLSKLSFWAYGVL